jgi:DNA-binding PadR family transcriptional regulator
MQSKQGLRSTAPTGPPTLGEFEQLLLLAILRCGDKAYTVPIRQVLGERVGRHVARGALFTTLDRLEAKGLVSSTMGEPLAVRGGRARRYFTVSPTGVDALRAARSAVAALSQGLESILER